MKSITLETERLVLKPIGHATQQMVKWLSDPLNTAFSEQRHKKHNIATQQAYIRKFDHVTSHIWMICYDKTGIGTITAHRDMNNLVADMGILIDRLYSGQGYGKEAWRAVMTYLLTDMRKVEAGTRADNAAMRKVMEACGMVPEGVRERHFMDGDEEFDLVLYGKMRWME